jgi:hypothetical protein
MLFLTAWQAARQAMLNELLREFAQALPAARMLEFKFILDDTELKGPVRRRIGGSVADLAERQRDLTPMMARLGPVDLWTLDTLITAGVAANRAEALRWVVARIRERPAYAKLAARSAGVIAPVTYTPSWGRRLSGRGIALRTGAAGQ